MFHEFFNQINFNKMKKLHYARLMAAMPTIYKSMYNKLGQLILFAEHPTQGDEYPVIAIFPELKEAYCTDFWDCGDFYPDSEYMPIAIHGTCLNSCEVEI